MDWVLHCSFGYRVEGLNDDIPLIIVLARDFECNLWSPVVVLHQREDRLYWLEVRWVGAIVDQRNVQLDALFFDLQSVMDRQVVQEQGDSAIALPLLKFLQKLNEVVAIDRIVLYLDKLNAFVIRDACNGGHAVSLTTRDANREVLVLATPINSHRAWSREHSLVDKDQLSTLVKDSFDLLPHCINCLRVLERGLSCTNLLSYYSFTLDSMILIDLRKLPGLDMLVEELPVEQLAPSGESLTRPGLERWLGRQVLDVLSIKSCSLFACLRSIRELVSKSNSTSYLVVEVALLSALMHMPRTVLELVEVILAIYA